MTASATVIGTASTTVIQSRPSMKFTRLTNHNVPTSSKMCSHHQGKSGSSCSSGGNVASAAVTAKLCSTSRGAAVTGYLSAIAPTAAISSTAAKMTTSGDIFRVGGAQ